MQGPVVTPRIAILPRGFAMALGVLALAGFFVGRASQEGPLARSVLVEPAGRVLALSFDPKGNTLATSAVDGCSAVWDLATVRRRLRFNQGSVPTNCATFSPGAKTLAIEAEGDAVALWDVKSGQLKRKLPAHESGIRALAYSRDGSILASADDGNVRFWDAETGEPRPGGFRQAYGVRRMDFSPDGRTLAIGTWDGYVYIRDLSGNRELLSMRAHSHCIAALAFASDGRTLATAGLMELVVRLWDAEMGRPITERRADARVMALAFGPRGHALAMGCSDGSVCVWDIRTGRDRALLLGHDFYVGVLAFAQDGRTLASGSSRGEVRLWDFDGE